MPKFDAALPTLGRRVTRVSYRFEPIETGTRVTVRHRDFGSVEAAREHAAGWERTLDLFCAYLAAERSSVASSVRSAPAAEGITIRASDDVTAIVETFGAKL